MAQLYGMVYSPQHREVAVAGLPLATGESLPDDNQVECDPASGRSALYTWAILLLCTNECDCSSLQQQSPHVGDLGCQQHGAHDRMAN